jgi:hypothetical protein
LPPNQAVAEVRVPTPEELIAQKVLSYSRRRDQPKGGTDLRDVMILLLAFPALQSEFGPVRDRLVANGADEAVLASWRELALTKIASDDFDDAG